MCLLLFQTFIVSFMVVRPLNFAPRASPGTISPRRRRRTRSSFTRTSRCPRRIFSDMLSAATPETSANCLVSIFFNADYKLRYTISAYYWPSAEAVEKAGGKG